MSTKLRDKKIPMGRCPLCDHDLRVLKDGKLACSNTGCTHAKKTVKLAGRRSLLRHDD